LSYVGCLNWIYFHSYIAGRLRFAGKFF
jgi:hypothetical protein